VDDLEKKVVGQVTGTTRCREIKHIDLLALPLAKRGRKMIHCFETLLAMHHPFYERAIEDPPTSKKKGEKT